MSDQNRSPEEEEFLRMMTPLISKEHLQAWLHKYLGFTIPDQIVTEFANSNPLDFVWQVYRAIMDGKPLHIMALSGRDSGKCCEKGTMILTNNGLKPIEKVTVGEQVWDGFKYQEVKETFDEGVKPGIRITTVNHRTLTGSPIHRVRGLENGKWVWKYLKDMKPSDLIATSIPQGSLELNTNESDLGYLCGLMVGDGGVSMMDNRNTVLFSNVDPGVSERWISLACRFLPVHTSITHDGRCTVKINSLKVCKALKDLGFESVKSIHKRLPKRAIENPSACIGFIAGMYDTDGGYEKDQLLIYQSNLPLLQDIQAVLASLGVISRVKETKIKSGGKRRDTISFFSIVLVFLTFFINLMVFDFITLINASITCIDMYCRWVCH